MKKVNKSEIRKTTSQVPSQSKIEEEKNAIEPKSAPDLFKAEDNEIISNNNKIKSNNNKIKSNDNKIKSNDNKFTSNDNKIISNPIPLEGSSINNACEQEEDIDKNEIRLNQLRRDIDFMEDEFLLNFALLKELSL